VRKLAEEFVPAADEVGRLQRGKDPECLLFQKVAEQGHYAGRTVPTDTRQGVYATAPSGALLASVNTNNPRKMAEMLKKALAKWRDMARAERLLADDPSLHAGDVRRAEALRPKDGLVLRVAGRDLPRGDDAAPNRRPESWNIDFAWFKKDEARAFVPDEPKVGATCDVPAAVVRRIARFSFVDAVRGQTPPFGDAHVERAEIRSTVEKVEESVVTLRFDGATRAEQSGRWPIDGSPNGKEPGEQTRGVETRLIGHATFDLAAGRFTAFEIVAAGPRHGATQYNFRRDDAGSAPIGFVLSLAADEPAERIAPAFISSYGWR